jgi:uncharacterized protein (TIGR00251 family)
MGVPTRRSTYDTPERRFSGVRNPVRGANGSRRMSMPSAEGLQFTIRVIPRAKRSGIDGIRGDAILVRLQAAPADGAANEELIDVIASVLQVPKRSVTIVSGAKSRQKRLRVVGVDAVTAEARLASKLRGK